MRTIGIISKQRIRTQQKNEQTKQLTEERINKRKRNKQCSAGPNIFHSVQMAAIPHSKWKIVVDIYQDDGKFYQGHLINFNCPMPCVVANLSFCVGGSRGLCVIWRWRWWAPGEARANTRIQHTYVLRACATPVRSSVRLVGDTGYKYISHSTRRQAWEITCGCECGWSGTEPVQYECGSIAKQ